ncbi:MAG TPA: ABC transporter permease [Bacillota bacterium]|nr:ABC transporter permease [Bacillota bacterium]HOH10834.1 ABC transporter permease [Bacillota bacterium]HOY89170.1 ABC transporter permease [Bacillota bacterium]HPI01238.1 ABC transporter permease [Bacillota bacterium]HPM63919.1 ABC transporter permease [Bacillota bacterium]
MKIREAFKLAAEGIRTNPMRAFLTSLGVVIGVAAVIVIIAIGEGARAQVISNIESLGSNIVYVTQGSAKPVPYSRQSSVLDSSVFVTLKGKVPGLVGAAAELTRGGAQVRYEKNTVTATVLGGTEDYMEVRNLELLTGRQFTKSEMDEGARVCLLGSDLADELVADGTLIGRQVKVDGVSYRVIGTFSGSAMGILRAMAGIKLYQVLIPLTTAQRRITGTGAVSSIYLKVARAEDMEAVKEAAEKALIEKMAYEENFTVTSQADLLDTLNTITRTMTYLLAGIAAVSLVVGGIGIMNIMLVSVTERIKEIGIRKALGATKQDILGQFLIEAVMISCAGGAVGMALGWSIAAIASKIAGWPSLVPWYSVVLALSFSMGIGLFFGVYPANKAASLQPVDALRYE